jgi:hypothetical protein
VVGEEPRNGRSLTRVEPRTVLQIHYAEAKMVATQLETLAASSAVLPLRDRSISDFVQAVAARFRPSWTRRRLTASALSNGSSHHLSSARARRSSYGGKPRYGGRRSA